MKKIFIVVVVAFTAFSAAAVYGALVKSKKKWIKSDYQRSYYGGMT